MRRTSSQRNSASGTWREAISTITGDTSTPSTRCPAPASVAAVGRPVPLPTSSTVLPGESRSSSQVSDARWAADDANAFS